MLKLKLLPESWKWHQVIVAGALFYVGMTLGGFLLDFVPSFVQGAARAAQEISPPEGVG